MKKYPVLTHLYDPRINLSLGWFLIINFQMGRCDLRRASQGGMGLPDGIGMHINPAPSPNKSGRDVVVSLTHVGTTASGMSRSPVSLKAFPRETPSKPHYTPPQPLLCGGYPSPETVVLSLSWCGPLSGCDPAGDGDLILRQPAAKTQPTSIVSWVRG